MRVKRLSSLSKQSNRVDFPLLMTSIILVIFGLIILFDASVVQSLKDFGDQFYYIRQQLIWVGVGVVSAIFFANFDYHSFKFLSFPLLLISLGLLVAVLIPGLGQAAGGAHRWLLIGFVTIQPAEIIKLTSVLYLASIFDQGARWKPLVILVIVVSLITAVLQKDLGSTIVYVATAALIYFAAGGSLWHFALMIPVGLVSLLGLILTSGYRSKRILAFLDPFSDTEGFTYHISQVLIALGSGGLTGLGLSQSRQKFEYIPEVTTDSIFAIVGEELGFLGSSLVVFLLALLVVRGLKIAEDASDNFGRILAVGLISWLGIQAIINLSSMVALVPLTGVPLPFISYGGSALVANLTAVGILLNISKQRP